MSRFYSIVLFSVVVRRLRELDFLGLALDPLQVHQRQQVVKDVLNLRGQVYLLLHLGACKLRLGNSADELKELDELHVVLHLCLLWVFLKDDGHLGHAKAVHRRLVSKATTLLDHGSDALDLKELLPFLDIGFVELAQRLKVRVDGQLNLNLVKELPAPLLPVVEVPVLLERLDAHLDCLALRFALSLPVVVIALDRYSHESFEEHEPVHVFHLLAWPLLDPGRDEIPINVADLQIHVVDQAGSLAEN